MFCRFVVAFYSGEMFFNKLLFHKFSMLFLCTSFRAIMSSLRIRILGLNAGSDQNSFIFKEPCYKLLWQINDNINTPQVCNQIDYLAMRILLEKRLPQVMNDANTPAHPDTPNRPFSEIYNKYKLSSIDVNAQALAYIPICQA